MLKKMLCKECDDEIVFDYVVPTKSFRINKKGEIERDDNNITDKPEIEFYCSSDKTHKIGDSKELNEWMDSVEHEFCERYLYLPERV